MLPPAIIFVNADINDAIKNTLITQLYIDESMTFNEFNARVQSTPTYPDSVHLQGRRILVILPTLQDPLNRALADVVLFYNQGQVTVEKNNFGPPGLSLPLQRVTLYALLRYNNSPYVVILPNTGIPTPAEDEERSETFGGGGIVTEELQAGTPRDLVEDPDEDDNLDFINRK
jgi:hypothetical protein